jgi:hypothetical protein
MSRRFRSQVFQHVRDEYRASAPELGLDMESLVHVSEFFQKREKYFDLALGIIGCIALMIVSFVIFDMILPFGRSGTIGIDTVSILFIVWVFAWLVQFYKSYQERYYWMPYFAKDVYDPNVITKEFRTSINEHARLPNDNDNLIIYRGFSPFAGAGLDLGGWSFVVDLNRPKEHAVRWSYPI